MFPRCATIAGGRVRETCPAVPAVGGEVVRSGRRRSGLAEDPACHCGDCAHIRAGTAGPTSRWLAVGLAGTGLAVIGLIVVWLSLIAGLIFLLVGGISAAWAYLRVRRDAAQSAGEHAGAALPQGG